MSTDAELVAVAAAAIAEWRAERIDREAARRHARTAIGRLRLRRAANLCIREMGR